MMFHFRQFSAIYRVYIFWCILFALFVISSGISININSKPREISGGITIIDQLKDDPEKRNSIPFADRQKLLSPYVDYYISRNSSAVNLDNPNLRRYDVYELKRFDPTIRPSFNYDYLTDKKNVFTPFLKTNALPGDFMPVVRKQKQQPDFSAIYGKLWVLKSRQERLPANPVVHDNSENYYIQKPDLPSRQILRKQKTSPITNIDIPPIITGGIRENNFVQGTNFSPLTTESHDIQNDVRTFINKQVVIDLKPNPYLQRYQVKPIRYHRPILSLQRTPIYYPEEQVQRTVLLAQSRPIKEQKQRSFPIVEENYVAQKYISRPKFQNSKETDFRQPDRFLSNYFKYEPIRFIQLSTPSSIPKLTENVNIGHRLEIDKSNSLSVVLKQLQDANALPQSLTADNIDNSIRTLAKILDSLKNHRKILKPIVVSDINGNHNISALSTVNYNLKKPDYTEFPEHFQTELVRPETNDYPEDTVEGGTPGMPGVDYPALNSIPPTSFDCKTQRYKGFFADPDTNCQVWHYCDLNGGQASFLCPNGTIFSQVALTCDWWYNVKCSLTQQLYVLNERLYKYILPFAPKFPEDYTGPLVDKYLALKFMEMEEKLKRERKEKEESTDQTTPMDETTEETTIGNKYE